MSDVVVMIQKLAKVESIKYESIFSCGFDG